MNTRRISATDKRPGSTQIDEQIKTTREALNLESITAPYLKQEQMPYNYASEFGFGSPRIPMVRKFIWLNLKLAALYTAKLFNILFRKES
jgi:hypothetical protein